MARQLPILLAVLAASCAFRRVQGAADVRVLPPERAEGCVALGRVKGTHANSGSTAENDLLATDEARNEVARLGGNTLVVVRRTTGLWHSVVEADAYRCAVYEDVPGLAPGAAPATTR